MNRVISIDRPERRRLEKIEQRCKDKRFSRRANAVVLVHKGKSRAEVAKVLAAARLSVNRWCKWCGEWGIEELKDSKSGKPTKLPVDIISQILLFLVDCTPQELGYQCSRWSSEWLAKVLQEHAGIKMHI